MTRTAMPITATSSDATSQPTLQGLLSQSEDEFYGSLQRIWNNVVQLEDMGIIQQENDKFVYAYRLAEAELHRAYSEKAFASLNAQVS